MPVLALLFSDLLLGRAVEAQVASLGSTIWCQAASDLADAKADVLLVEDIMLQDKAVYAAAPLLFVIGEASDVPDDATITETFTKPLRLGHLLARVQWQLTLHQQAQDVPVPLGPYTFVPSQKVIERPDQAPLKLTEKEAALLVYLVRAGQPVSRDELLAEIWGYDGRIDTHTLETHVCRLRALPDLRDLISVKQGFYHLNASWMVPE